MGDVFFYEDLTWPEISALPRNTPLILPFGNGFSLESLRESLNYPTRIGLLPPIPYGWVGSFLPVPEAVFLPLIRNLISSLRDDGFSQVYALMPQGLDLDLGPQGLILPARNRPIAQPLFPSDEDRLKIVLIPIGHTEQHGYHLPMNTDTIIVDAIAKGVVDQKKELAVSLPAMPYGVSTHRASFAGTLNCGGRAFEDFWLAVVDRLVGRGFDRFYFISGHGGNGSFLTNVVKYLGERFSHTFIATSWLYLSGPKGIAALDAYRQSKIGGMGHAGELETSLILYLRPDLTHMDRVIDEIDFITTPSYYMDWVEGGSLIANPPWGDDTRTGAYGAGSLGTTQKGVLWLQAAIDEKIDHLHEINEQFTRRMIKRRTNLAS